MAQRKKRSQIKLTKQHRKKLVVLFIIIAILLILLIVRLMFIQKADGQRYEKIVLNQQGYGNEVLPFQRGDILDCKGTVLATSVDVYNVILDCKLINEDKKYRKPTIAALTTCFEDVTAEEIETLLVENKDSQYCVLRKKQPYEKMKQFSELKEDKKKNPNLTGVWFEKEYIRNYPFDNLACKVLGFTTSGNEGIGGLEDYYNETLNGITGRQFGYLNSDNNFQKTTKNAINGNTLVTTIDGNVQDIIEKKIAAFNEAHKDEFIQGPGSKNTGVLVMNVKNGEIIAMADSYSYNLNDPWNLSGYFTPEEIAAKSSDETLDALNRIWQNFCITTPFEPGSTVKPLTVAAGLDMGVLNDQDGYVCTGSKIVVEGTKPINCANGVAHGQMSTGEVIMKSCNSALMEMGLKMGVDSFTKYQNVFNLGLKTNIDLPGEARTDTLIYTAAEMGIIDLATNAFGQNYKATMIQVATSFASIVNGGYYYQPHIVKRITDENGYTVADIQPVMLKQTISTETTEIVKGYLEKTVTDGTGKYAKVSGYSMGGKTGTAEVQPRGNGNYVISFIGYTPAENPEILVYVAIDEPNLENQAQSRYASEMAKEILTECLPYLNIFPDEEPTPPDPEADPVPDIPTPDPEGEGTPEDEPVAE